jgi:hypothetical protein
VGGCGYDNRKARGFLAKPPQLTLCMGLTWGHKLIWAVRSGSDGGRDRGPGGGLGPLVHDGPGPIGITGSNLGRRFRDGRLGWPVSGRRRCPVVGRRRLAGDLTGVARNRARRPGLQGGWAQNEEWKESNPTTGSWRWLERRRGRHGSRCGRLNFGERRWVLLLGVCETKGKMRFLTLLRCSG